MYPATRSLFASVASLALVACGGSNQYAILVPATEMPYLGKTTSEEFQGVPTVTALDGQTHELKGRVTNVDIVMKRRTESVDAPFSAQITSADLEVTTDNVRAYPLADISYVTVKYTDEGFQSGRYGAPKPEQGLSTKQIVGIGLAVGSIVPFAIGAVVFAVDSSCRSPGGLSVDVCAAGTLVLGSSLIGLGGGMLITGLILGASGRSTKKSATTIQPRLGLSPLGGSLSFEF